MGYQFFLPMVLRWRASRAEAPLITISIEVRIRITKALAHKFVQFSALIVITISTRAEPCGILEKMTSFSQILNPDLEQGKLMAAVNSRKERF